MSEDRPLDDIARLLEYGTATVAEVNPDVRIWDSGLRPLAPGMRAAGLAYTAVCRPGDNLALHRALARLRDGDILAVDYGGSVESGPFGEIMARALQTRGAPAMIIDGAVRDSAAIRALGVPVFCRGLNIRGTSKSDPGTIGTSAVVGGAEVSTGDIVLADDDAVISFPPDQLAATLTRAQARWEKEEEVMRRVGAGETTLEIFDLHS